MSVLSVENLRVRYSDAMPEILKGVSFTAERDDFLAIIGPSGAGKSTLIRSINRLVKPTAGSIMLFGNDVCVLKEREMRALRRNVGMIYKNGVPMRKVAGEDIVEAFVRETEKLLEEGNYKEKAEPELVAIK